VALNQKVNVQILDFDKNTGRISLGLKQLTPYPWEGVEERFPVGRRVKGKVVSLTDYGAFVELEKGVEGLIHIAGKNGIPSVTVCIVSAYSGILQNTGYHLFCDRP
jgi:ribosomal protein S1